MNNSKIRGQKRKLWMKKNGKYVKNLINENIPKSGSLGNSWRPERKFQQSYLRKLAKELSKKYPYSTPRNHKRIREAAKRDHKTIIIFYLSNGTIHHLNQQGGKYIQMMQRRLGKEYSIIVMPAEKSEPKVEIFYKDKPMKIIKETVFESMMMHIESNIL